MVQSWDLQVDGAFKKISATGLEQTYAAKDQLRLEDGGSTWSRRSHGQAGYGERMASGSTVHIHAGAGPMLPELV